ncbi:cupin [Falsibacillus pallidus]|uniref:Cupin n=1 Tax=Falsibacillus pallidus TaxID=493781 RepID=A0A370G3X7_9BACI|nr:cupin [Falsibacillus pallidus]RDI38462.1 hypothetical protein DFR59_1173 [Falsibacillus pallidus]
MKFFRFDEEVKRSITAFNSRNVGISPIMKSAAPSQIGCMHFSGDSVLGMHPATCPQLFLVTDGSGWVKLRGEDPVPVEAGTAVFWETGEEHESGSANGMTAFVMEGEHFSPEKFMPALTPVKYNKN